MWDKYGREIPDPKDRMERCIGGKSEEVWGSLGKSGDVGGTKSWRTWGVGKIFIGNDISGTRLVWASPKLVQFTFGISLHCEPSLRVLSGMSCPDPQTRRDPPFGHVLV